MSTPFGPVLSMWEAEGNRHASAFDACAGAVVIGERPTVAAEVALGIARVQARRRRVAVADAVGELGPLEDLVPMDAPYGLVDSFFYGVSLNKVAYTVDPARNLIIFPSGAVPIDQEALLSSDRWAKLLDAFRAADGLLLIVAPADSSALSSLIQVMDGVALVGNVAAAPGTRVLAHARLPVIPARPTPPSISSVALARGTQQPRVSTPAPAPAPVPPSYAPPPQPPPRSSFHDAPGAAVSVDEHDDEHDHERENAFDRETTAAHTNGDLRASEGANAAADAPAAMESQPRADVDSPVEDEAHVSTEEGPALVPPWARNDEFAEHTLAPIDSAKTFTFWAAIIAGAFVAAALLTWITTSVMARNNGVDSFAARPDSSQGAAHVIAAPAPTGLAAGRDTAASAAAAAPVAAAASTIATPFSVVLADNRSVTGANGELEQASGREFPAVTYAPYRRADGAMSYVVISGAFPDSAGADSLLRQVRAKRYRTAAAAHVVRLPYALLIQKGVSQDQAPMFVHAYLTKGLPVYSLVQADGTASLWAGAFRTAEQAQPLVTSFRANGDTPTVTIRTGRSF
jgi:hypothetical protein